MQQTYPVPTQADQEAFVYRLYFGAVGDTLDQIIKRAYQDFSRTVHGAGNYSEAHREAANFLHGELESLPSKQSAFTQQGFDGWHEVTCRAICAIYAKAGYEQFSIGQAQKWINMALKYIFVFGEVRLRGYSRLYPLCHIPIDNIVLSAGEFSGLAGFRESWSRIKDYTAYMSFQTAVRQHFSGSAPLAVEFTAWQRANAV